MRVCRAPTRTLRRRQTGYVLILVLASLALIALVAGRFAVRIDAMRQQTGMMQDQARAEIEAESASASALFWLSTQMLNTHGVGDGVTLQWVADGRWYPMGERAWVSLQDERGLIAINASQNLALRHLLVAQGLDSQRVDRMIDVLEDYIDSDQLKRLNGAEAADYRALGLDGPRNDFVMSVRELLQMPVWRDDPAFCERLFPLLSSRRSAFMNPNTGPTAVLKALWPAASPQQLELFDTLRKAAPFQSGAAATAATGLSQADEEYVYHVSNEVRLTVWVPGMPRAFEYNLMLLPGSRLKPWQITEFHTVVRPTMTPSARQSFEFPLQFLTSPRLTQTTPQSRIDTFRPAAASGQEVRAFASAGGAQLVPYQILEPTTGAGR